MTLIVPESIQADLRFQEVGRLTRTEAESLVVGYTFDLRTNELKAERIPNPSAGTDHRFGAYRLASQSPKSVSMLGRLPVIDESNEPDAE